MKKIPRTQNLADMLTHTSSAQELEVPPTVDESQELQCTRQRVDGHETVQTGSSSNSKVYSHG